MPSMAAPSFGLMPEMYYQPAQSQSQCQAQCEIELAATKQQQPIPPTPTETSVVVSPPEPVSAVSVVSTTETPEEVVETLAPSEACNPPTTKGRRKTKICKLWQEARCRRRRCPFAHGEEELRHYEEDTPDTPSAPVETPAVTTETPFWMKCAAQLDTQEVSEVACLGMFMQPNSEQRGHRNTIRDMVHHFVLENVDRTAITKVTGASAACLDMFDSDLDLVVDVSDVEQYAGSHVAQLSSAMSASGVMCRTATRADQTPIVSFDSCAMSAVHQKWSKSHFNVNVTFCQGGFSSERREFSVIQAALQKSKAQRILIPAITAVLQCRMQIPSRCVFIMVLAFFEHSRTHYKYDDLEWLFREFFAFYAKFDFATHGVCLSDAPFPRKTESSEGVWVPAVVTEENCAGGLNVTELRACFAYVDGHLSGGGALQDLISTELVKQRDAVLYECSDPTYVAKETALLDTLKTLTSLLSDTSNHVHRATVRNTLLHFHPALPLSRTLPVHDQNSVQVQSQLLYTSLFDPE